MAESHASGISTNEVVKIADQLRAQENEDRNREIERNETSQSHEHDFAGFKLSQTWLRDDIDLIVGFDGSRVLLKNFDGKIQTVDFNSKGTIDSWQKPPGIGPSDSIIAAPGNEVDVLLKHGTRSPDIRKSRVAETIVLTSLARFRYRK